jgi:hypothetical protein
MRNNGGMKTEKLTLRRILSVRCPMCRAKPKEPCTLSTGHPSTKTHLARELAAAKAPLPETSSHAALRILKKATNRGFRALFPHKT